MKIFRLSLCIAALLAAGHATAATETDSFAVTAEVIAACAIDAAPDLGLGNYNPVTNTGGTGTATIQVRCTNGHAYQVALDDGLNFLTTRKMSGGSGTDKLDYDLYLDAGYTSRWGDTLGTDSSNETGSGEAQNHVVYGRVAPGQGTAVKGSYTDTVTVTVNF